MRIFNVIEGWKKYFDIEVSEEEKKRANVCKKCTHSVVGTYEKFMPDNQLKEVQGLKCNICKCPLSTKLRSQKEKCPLKKW